MIGGYSNVDPVLGITRLRDWGDNLRPLLLHILMGLLINLALNLSIFSNHAPRHSQLWLKLLGSVQSEYLLRRSRRNCL